MRKLPPKHRRQIAEKIVSLRHEPLPPDSEQLKGLDYRRADIGEYRVILYTPQLAAGNRFGRSGNLRFPEYNL